MDDDSFMDVFSFRVKTIVNISSITFNSSSMILFFNNFPFIFCYFVIIKVFCLPFDGDMAGHGSVNLH